MTTLERDEKGKDNSSMDCVQRIAIQILTEQRQSSSSSSSSLSWWSLGLEDDIICASYLWVREWLCRPIQDLQSRAQSGHWKVAFVAGIEAAKWRRSLADCTWWRCSSSSADDAGLCKSTAWGMICQPRLHLSIRHSPINAGLGDEIEASQKTCAGGCLKWESRCMGAIPLSQP